MTIFNRLELKHSPSAYLGDLILMLIVTAVVLVFARSINYEMVLVLAAIWCMSLGWYWIGLISYRIVVTDKTIKRYAFGLKPVELMIEEISMLQYEMGFVKRKTDSLLEKYSMRPMRRITIYGRRPELDYLDISLKHFKLADLNRTLQQIVELRPDLRDACIKASQHLGRGNALNNSKQ